MRAQELRVSLASAVAALALSACGGSGRGALDESAPRARARPPELAGVAPRAVPARDAADVPVAAPSASAPGAASAPAEPPADALRALAAIQPDPAPAGITLDTHYVVSNEDRPQAFYRALQGLGGAYVGVGAEQSFLFGGWARAEILLLIDFDDWVVETNEVYGLILAHAETPDDAIALWSEPRSPEVERWIDASTPDPSVRARRREIFLASRKKVHHRLTTVRQWLDTAKLPFFGNDPAELDHLARLFREGRVRCVRGDLTASGSLRAFGELARRSGWPVRALYMSNAEQYFEYEQGSFRENLRSLPFDDRSIVLHTQSIDSKRYNYLWQSAPPYVEWVGRTKSYAGLLEEAGLPLRGKLSDGAWLITPP